MPELLTEDIVPAMTDHLAALARFDPAFQATLGSFSDGTPYVFQDRNEAMLETSGMVTLLGKRSTAIVVRQSGSWGTPNLHNTARFPRVVTEIFADPDRDDTGKVTVHNGRDKLMRVHQQMRHYLHMTHPRAQWWPLVLGEDADYAQLRIERCVSQDDYPQIFDVPDGDGLVRGETSWAVTVTGARGGSV